MSAMGRALLGALLAALAFGVASVAAADTVRFATYNVSMGLAREGELARRLAGGDDPALRKLAEILQRMRPDVILLNEFDYQEGVDRAGLLNRNYLSRPQRGHEPIEYPYAFSAPVNTGVDSGLDLDQDGRTGDPADAWGFGRFPGQYGMLVLSRYPIRLDEARTFQHFLWQDMPDAMRPLDEDGELFYPEKTWLQLRLSSKSHWDLPICVGDVTCIHLLASHPTPPVFDGPEDRNGRRNHDEVHFWADYVSPDKGDYIYDDAGSKGGLERGETWLLAGDMNADPLDGEALSGSIDWFTENPYIDDSCVPASRGGVEAAEREGGLNRHQHGDPANDTADFDDEHSGNLRVDYLLTSRRVKVTACGVYWPASDEDGHDLVDFSDHRMVWVDLDL